MIDRGRADCAPDVKSGGRDLEQRTEEHPGSVPGSGAGRQECVLSRGIESVAFFSEGTVRGLVWISGPAPCGAFYFSCETRQHITLPFHWYCS